MYRLRFLQSILLLFILFFRSLSFCEESFATVLMYHRFDEPKYPSTNIDSKIFEEQMSLLKSQNYSVLPLSELVLFFEQKKRLPEKSIFITMDDGYKSIFTKAYPIMKKFNYPFSVFVSTDFISNNSESNYMTWKMLKELSINNVEILNHSSNHKSFLESSDEEILNSIIKGEKNLKEKIGKSLKIFSFPYGDSNLKIESLLESLGYKISFAQHSSPIHLTENKLRLPRFSLNNEYGNLKRFRTIVKAQPLMAEDILPLDTKLDKKFPFLEFETNFSPKKINCFINKNAKINKKIVGAKRIRLELLQLVSKKKYRINCTYTENTSLYWFGKEIIFEN